MTKVELKLNKLEEVELEDVNWLWYPYIPFGKITVIQGDPAQGKTHLLLKIAAQCTTGDAFPDTKAFEPFNVIYQTAEDGLGDTIKPRLIMSGADQSRIVNIDEDELPLNVLDERVEEAILLAGLSHPARLRCETRKNKKFQHNRLYGLGSPLLG